MYLFIFSIALLGLCLGGTDVVYHLEHRGLDRLTQPGVSQKYVHGVPNLDEKGLDGRHGRDVSHFHGNDIYRIHAQRDHLYTRDANLVHSLSRRHLCQRSPMGQCFSSSNNHNPPPQYPLFRSSSGPLSSATALGTASSLGANSVTSLSAESMFASASIASAKIPTMPALRWSPGWNLSPPPPPPPPSPRSRAGSRAGSRVGSVASFASFADWRGLARLSSGSQSDGTTHGDSPQRKSFSDKPPTQLGSVSSSNLLSRPSMRGILRTSGSFPIVPATPAFGSSLRPSGAISRTGSVGRLSRAGSPGLPISGYGVGQESADSQRDPQSIVYVSSGGTRTSKDKTVRIRAASGQAGIFFSGHDYITGASVVAGGLKNAVREGAANARAAGSVTHIEAFTPDVASQQTVTAQVTKEFPGIQPVVYLYPGRRSGDHIFEALPGQRGSPPLVTSWYVPTGQ